MFGKLMLKPGDSGSETEKGGNCENQPLPIVTSQTREWKPSPPPLSFNLSSSTSLLTRILHPKPDALYLSLPNPNHPLVAFNEWIRLHLVSAAPYISLPTPLKSVEIESPPPPQLHVASPVLALGAVSPTLVLGCLGIACLFIGSTIYSKTVLDRHEYQQPLVH